MNLSDMTISELKGLRGRIDMELSCRILGDPNEGVAVTVYRCGVCRDKKIIPTADHIGARCPACVMR